MIAVQQHRIGSCQSELVILEDVLGSKNHIFNVLFQVYEIATKLIVLIHSSAFNLASVYVSVKSFVIHFTN